MTTKISEETIEYIGILAKLELSEEEKEQARKDMQKMLDYVEQLKELDTSEIEPMTHLFLTDNVFREDEVTKKDGSKELMANAPKVKDGQLLVPKTIGAC